MFTGKGGVGKTSLAAATGVKLAALNYRTLVTSIDPALTEYGFDLVLSAF
jgi:arsenite-transporting ATPase